MYYCTYTTVLSNSWNACISLNYIQEMLPFNTKGTVKEVAYEQQEDEIYEDPDSLLMLTHGSQFSTYSIVPSWVSGSLRWALRIGTYACIYYCCYSILAQTIVPIIQSIVVAITLLTSGFHFYKHRCRNHGG